MTWKELPTNNGLLMRNVFVQLCLAANDNILLMRKLNYAFLLLAIVLFCRFQSVSLFIQNKLAFEC